MFRRALLPWLALQSKKMLLIPFGHLFIGGKRKKRELTWILLLCLYAVILSCGSPTDEKNAFDLISWNILLFSTPVRVYFRHISEAFNE